MKPFSCRLTARTIPCRCKFYEHSQVPPSMLALILHKTTVLRFLLFSLLVSCLLAVDDPELTLALSAFQPVSVVSARCERRSSADPYTFCPSESKCRDCSPSTTILN